MQLNAVDHSNNLFSVCNVVPQSLVDQILTTDWLSKPWYPQSGQEAWKRRRIDDRSLSWINQWNDHCVSMWPEIASRLGMKFRGYQGTAWWLDEPGFVCTIHTDGEMPGAMQLTWVADDPALATCFYHYKNQHCIRHQFTANPNSGYIMINRSDDTGYRLLQWHGMLNPVPSNSFRLTSYSWITTEK